MNNLLINYIIDVQERNSEAIVTILDSDTVIIDHNVGNYTLEYIDASEENTLKRQHIPFNHIKHLVALVDLHKTLNHR